MWWLRCGRRVGRGRVSPSPRSITQNCADLTTITQPAFELLICPFCDEPLSPRRPEWFAGLPRTRFTTLPELIQKLWNESDPDPRPTNTNGRKPRAGQATLTSQTCTQHQYEIGCLPIYAQYRWPVSMDYSQLVERLRGQSVMSRLLLVFEFPLKSVLMLEWETRNGPVTRRTDTLPNRTYKTLSERINKEMEPLSYAG